MRVVDQPEDRATRRQQGETAGGGHVDDGAGKRTSLPIGTIVPAIVNTGSVQASGGTLTAKNGIQGSGGNVTVNSGATLDLSQSAVSRQISALAEVRGEGAVADITAAIRKTVGAKVMR